MKLILQPMVENAVTHGLRPRGAGVIVIEDSAVDEVLAFTVTDDGVGIGEADLLRLRSEMRRTDGSECYGIANVDRRIRLFFGDECGLAIESMKDAGTVVTIRIPPADVGELDRLLHDRNLA